MLALRAQTKWQLLFRGVNARDTNLVLSIVGLQKSDGISIGDG